MRTKNYNDNEYEDYSINRKLKVSDNDNGKLIDYFLTEEIESIDDYIDFLREVEMAKPNDSIRLHINCYGGDVNVALNIYDALRNTEANVQINIEGIAASAASMIMLAGNYWSIYPHSCVMIHAWSSFSYGKWNELEDRFKFEKEIWENQFREIYKKFLTDEEIEQCLKGKDFWFSADETSKRLDNYQAEEAAKNSAANSIVEKYTQMMQKEFDLLNKQKAVPKTSSKKKQTVKPKK